MVTKAKSNIAGNYIFLLIVSLHIHGAYNAFFGGVLSVIGLWPLVISSIFIFQFIRPKILGFDLRVTGCLVLCMALGIGIFKSPDVPYSVSIFSVTLVSSLFLVALNGRLIDFKRVRISIYKLSVFISALSIILYFVMLPIAISHLGGDGYRPGYGILLDRGVTPRAAGLNGDSNFFAMLLCLGIFCFLEEPERGSRAGIALIICALLLSMSRSAFLAVLICVLLFYRNRLNYKMIFAGGVLLVASLLIFVDPDFLSTLVERRIYGAVGTESRFNLWLPKLESYPISLTGNGLNIMKFDTGRFSHNTFLDVIIELGLLGFFLFMMFLGSCFYYLLTGARFARAVGVFMFLMLPFFSLLYSPLIMIPLLLSKESRGQSYE